MGELTPEQDEVLDLIRDLRTRFDIKIGNLSNKPNVQRQQLKEAVRLANEDEKVKRFAKEILRRVRGFKITNMYEGACHVMRWDCLRMGFPSPSVSTSLSGLTVRHWPHPLGGHWIIFEEPGNPYFVMVVRSRGLRHFYLSHHVTRCCRKSASIENMIWKDIKSRL